MKVLHVAPGNLFGGVEQILVALAREAHLVPDMEPSFALCFEDRLSRTLLGVDARLHLLGAVQARRPWTVSRARQKLRQLLASEHWDVVACHSAWSQAIFGPVAQERKIAQIFWLHDVPSPYHWIEKWASLHPPDLAVCNSRFTASHLTRVFPKVPFAVIYPLSGPTQPVVISLELMRREGVVTILHATRMQYGKGHRVLLNALAQLATIPGWRCWFAGGPQRPSEISFAEEISHYSVALGLASRVSFLGFREDVPSLMSLADLYCQPNETPEAFGITFVEALRAGLPVVTSAFGGATEILDETCGRLVAPGDSKELAAVLASLIQEDNLRGELARASPARADALCAPKKILLEVRDIFASVIR